MIIELNREAPYFYDLAMEKGDNGDYIGALYYLRRALVLLEQTRSSKKRGNETDILSIKAEIAATYSDMGLFEYSLKQFFKLLPNVGELGDEIYFGIIKNFALLNMVDEATYYLSDGICKGHLDPSDGFASLQPDNEQPPELRLIKNNDNEYMLDIARQLMATPEKDYAKQILSNIKPVSGQYCEAQTYLSLIKMSEGDAGEALTNAETALKVNPNDLNATAAKIMALDMLNRTAQRDEVVSEVECLEYTDYKDLLKLTMCMANISNSEKTFMYAKKLIDLAPFDRDVNLYYALSAFNMGQKALAKSTICNALEIYPDDYTLKYYAKCISFLDKGNQIKLLTDLPMDEQHAIYEDTEQWLTDKKTVKKVVELLKVDSEMQSNIRYIFQCNNIPVIVRVGAFLAQAPDWHDFLREQILDPNFPLVAKKEILLNILKFSKNKQFFIAVNNQVREFNPKLPRLATSIVFEDAYFQVYCVLAFAEIDFDAKLNESYKKVVAALKNEVGLDETVLAAVIAYKSRANKIFFQKDFCAEIFGCEQSDFLEYLALINDNMRLYKNLRKESKK